MNTYELGYAIHGLEQLIHDRPARSSSQESEFVVNERHFHDLCNLLLMKIINMAGGEQVTSNDQRKMKMLLEEIFQTKAILEEKG